MVIGGLRSSVSACGDILNQSRDEKHFSIGRGPDEVIMTWAMRLLKPTCLGVGSVVKRDVLSGC